MNITDGTGNGYQARVTYENRLFTDAIITSHIMHESGETGTAYIVASDFISLTTTSDFNGLLYFKNTDNAKRNFHVSHFRVCGGNTASPAQTLQVKLLLNATSGTLISEANPAITNNLNTNYTAFDYPATAYAASGDGKTVTDGTHYTQFINHLPGHSIQDYSDSMIISFSNSLAIVAKPSLACTVCVELIGYFETPTI